MMLRCVPPKLSTPCMLTSARTALLSTSSVACCHVFREEERGRERKREEERGRSVTSSYILSHIIIHTKSHHLPARSLAVMSFLLHLPLSSSLKGGNSLDAVTPGLTLGTLYSSGVGINKTKQHACHIRHQNSDLLFKSFRAGQAFAGMRRCASPAGPQHAQPDRIGSGLAS